MPSQPDPDTLFHLVPVNQFASQALHDPINAPFVSPSRDGRPGLEVGFHVPSVPRAPLITRLGQDADLNLRLIDFRHSMSRVHATFKFEVSDNHEGFVVLTTRSKATVSYAAISYASSAATRKAADEGRGEETVSLQEPSTNSVNVGEVFTGGGVIDYGTMRSSLHRTASACSGYTAATNPESVLI
ncbi:hypothetical protein GGR51DRAFT_291942 [Nemania sp. FL0031]|nr:hypothetical protein GGR51DRAFT_291942 [Nemania sp. FL0031]